VAERTFGLDFGTTNSLAAFVDEVTGRMFSFTDANGRPHPSVVWYRGSDVIVGPKARRELDSGDEAISGNFVRSPKRLLSSDAPIYIGGRTIDPSDVIAEVLKFIKADATTPERSKNERSVIDRAVFSVPVELDGLGRQRLRRAARSAGISVVQFVHEPLAALYGYLRAQSDFHHQLTELEGQRLLVFDWGGGTLDLTLCLVTGGRLVQIASRGDNDVGGDRFDDVIRNLVMEKHAAAHGIEDVDAHVAEGARTRLLTECENAKIRLSKASSSPIVVRGFLRGQPGRDLALELTREEVERAVDVLAQKGLSQIDRLLVDAGLSLQEIAFCLPTGGMVNMPLVRNGLLQRFGARLKNIDNGDRIIAEGAAWIAHDGARLTLAKPIEILNPDNTYTSLVDADLLLPVDNEVVCVNQSMFYCVDPRDGLAHFQFARPKRVGYGSQRSERLVYGTASLKIDPFARPLLERLEAKVEVDADYVVKIDLASRGRGERASLEIHNLEFALALPTTNPSVVTKPERESTDSKTQRPAGGVRLRSNVTRREEAWQLVPGDVVKNYKPGWLDVRGSATSLQVAESLYYAPCATCRRSTFECEWDGCELCPGVPNPAEALVRRARYEARPNEGG
jgi:molecular chaperone DnaK